jgi:hypothetical protein
MASSFDGINVGANGGTNLPLTTAAINSAKGHEKSYKLTDSGGLHPLILPRQQNRIRSRQPRRGGPILAALRMNACGSRSGQLTCVIRRSLCIGTAPSSLLALGQNRLRHGG